MSKKNYSIYKAQNEHTGEAYIGATTKSIHQRKLDHTERASRGKQGKFQEAIRTYGPEAFSWEQIDTATSIDELAIKEQHYILEYSAKEKGYNSDIGGGFKKSVYQYSIIDGLLVNKYDCLQSAGDSVSASKKAISQACLSIKQIYAGFYWSYKL